MIFLVIYFAARPGAGQAQERGGDPLRREHRHRQTALDGLEKTIECIVCPTCLYK